MNTPFLDSLPSQVQGASPPSGTSTDPSLAREFGSFMDGLSASPAIDHRPSAISMVVRLPVAECDRVMASLQAPVPEGASIAQAMEFYTQKQIDLNNMKTMQHLATTAVKLARKNVETVMNSK